MTKELIMSGIIWIDVFGGKIAFIKARIHKSSNLV